MLVCMKFSYVGFGFEYGVVIILMMLLFFNLVCSGSSLLLIFMVMYWLLRLLWIEYVKLSVVVLCGSVMIFDFGVNM